MKVATKLRAAFAVHILLLAVLLVYHVRTLRHVVSSGHELTQISSRAYTMATEQAARIAQLEENAAKHAITRDIGYHEKFLELAAAFSRDLELLHNRPLTPDEHGALAALTEQWRGFSAYALSLDPLIGSADGAAEPPAELRLRLDALRALTRSLSDASREAMLAQLARNAAAARRAERLSWLAASVALILSVLISALIVRSIADALARLAHGTREVARGRFGHRLATDRGDEFAEVAQDFNTMTERLDELDRMKRDFVSKVSHDLKTPLASMQETIDALLDGVAGPLPPQQRRLLELNYQSGERLYEMLGKLLDLSSLESGAVRPRMEQVDLRDLARTVADTHSRPGADVRLTIPRESVMLHCDPDRILQLMHNLVENAVKFASPGGVTLVVRLRADEQPTAEIIVSDDGPGIPDEDKPRVFERFYQAAAGRAARARGVGLGLTICQEIALVHDGSIRIDDRAGGGAEFHVLLPDHPAEVPDGIAGTPHTVKVPA